MTAVPPDLDRQEQRQSTFLAGLIDRIAQRRYTIGIVGLGYVGIPLALTAVQSKFRVLGFDIDPDRVRQINRGESFMNHVESRAIAAALQNDRFEATTDFGRIGEADAILIAVPTPLTRQREPDMSFIAGAGRSIAPGLRRGQLVVLESTTWPGTTDEVLRPILETSGLRSGVDFFLGFSPEREDPGNESFGTATIPKVVGGDGADALQLTKALYDQLVVRTVPVSSTAAAEAVKLTENIFRSVNIALANELKIIYTRMGIDVWEVIEAAKTKPFGYMAFYPGPGLGGHCIPIDPFYLTWKAREYDIVTRFIELAGQINTSMPSYVVERLARALDAHQSRGLNGTKILILGLAYKRNIDDMRESPSLRLIELLEERGARVDYHDPHIAIIPAMREHPTLAGRMSQTLSAETVGGYHAVLVSTDHEAVDYRHVAAHARLIVDTRNACARAGADMTNVIKA